MSPPAYADIAVIMNASSGVTELSRRQLVDVYMGRSIIAPNGKVLAPYDHPVDSEIRKAFYQLLTGKSAASINAYWARLLFTGRASPPRQALNSAMVLKITEDNPSAIGYLHTSDLNGHANIIYRIKSEK